MPTYENFPPKMLVYSGTVSFMGPNAVCTCEIRSSITKTNRTPLFLFCWKLGLDDKEGAESTNTSFIIKENYLVTPTRALLVLSL